MLALHQYIDDNIHLLMIQIKQFTFNPFQENTYLLIAGNKAVLIDPGMSNKQEESLFLLFIKENDIELEAVWLTHAHIDHIMGLAFIQNTYRLPIYMHSLERENLKSGPLVAKAYGIPFEAFTELDIKLLDTHKYIELEGAHFDILFTPGHSAGSICFYHKPTDQLIGGDVLFYQSIGRTDLPGGDFATLKQSIQEKLYKLPNATTVYSGHGPETTIGFEKMNNAFVKA